jgi:tetratricopeptide (TPR) repeat protein
MGKNKKNKNKDMPSLIRTVSREKLDLIREPFYQEDYLKVVELVDAYDSGQTEELNIKRGQALKLLWLRATALYELALVDTAPDALLQKALIDIDHAVIELNAQEFELFDFYVLKGNFLILRLSGFTCFNKRAAAEICDITERLRDLRVELKPTLDRFRMVQSFCLNTELYTGGERVYEAIEIYEKVVLDELLSLPVFSDDDHGKYLERIRARLLRNSYSCLAQLYGQFSMLDFKAFSTKWQIAESMHANLKNARQAACDSAELALVMGKANYHNYFSLASSFLISEKFKEAEKIFNAIEVQFPQMLENPWRIFYFSSRKAELLTKLGRYQEALLCALAAVGLIENNLDMHPDKLFVYSIRARIYCALGSYEEAKTDFLLLKKYQPESEDIKKLLTMIARGKQSQAKVALLEEKYSAAVGGDIKGIAHALADYYVENTMHSFFSAGLSCAGDGFLSSGTVPGQG